MLDAETFRSAVIEGGEMTLWVRNDRFAMVAQCTLSVQ
jgi:hypothetical protein